MTDRVVLLHSPDGLDARVYLLPQQAGATLKARGDDWRELLEEGLAAT